MPTSTARNLSFPKIVNLLKFNDIPDLPSSISIDDVIETIIPTGFESVFNSNINANGELELVFSNAENEFDNKVVIPQFIFNPARTGAVFPKFLCQVSTLSAFKNKRPDYLGTENRFILNQNQLLYTIIHHRCSWLSKHTNQYIGLLRSDLRRLKEFIDFVSPNSYNAKAKFNNTYCIINPFASNSNVASPKWRTVMPGVMQEFPIGELIDIKHAAHAVREDIIKAVLSDVPLQPGSDSMLQKSGKIVISDNLKLYRSPCYRMVNHNDEKYLISLFDRKQNLPARLKSHLLTDCFEAVDCIKHPVILQDMVLNSEGKYQAKDNGLLPTVIVFHDMDIASGRFMFGEMEQTAEVASRKVIKRQIIHEQFSQIFVKEGSRSLSGSLTLGLDLNENPVVLNHLIDAEVILVDYDELNQSAKIVLNCTLEAGNARILTSTGLKAFTKTIPHLGTITTDDGTILNVDMITGMNAMKGKQNAIVLARACLAHKLGIFNNNKSYLSSWDEKEINAAANCIKKVEYTDIHGNKSMVWAGYMEYYVTELAAMYSKFKPQNFMFEIGKYLEMQKDKALFNHVFGDCLDHQSVSIATELHKILSDDVGLYAAAENLPVYTPEELRKVYSQDDLVLVSQSRWDTSSKLFDPEVNKGFYITLANRGGPLIRIMSANSLNALRGTMPSGEFIYPKIISCISRILQALIVRSTKHQGYNLGFVWNDKNPTHLLSAYLKEAKGIMYTNEDKGMTMAQSLIKPKIMGINMKQLTDHLIPWDVVVVYDRNLYHQIQAYVVSDDYENSDLGAVTMHGKEIYAFAVRNPALWSSQLNRVRIWDEEKFNEYLWSIGVDPKKHMSGKYCRHSILISTYITLIHHSDNDGDSLPIFILKAAGQKLLENFKLESVSPEEAGWTVDFYHGEFDANQVLYDEPVYKLNAIPLAYSNTDKRTYAEFLINAAIAKSNIGSATSDIWCLYAVLQLYQAFCKTRKTDDPSFYNEHIATWRVRSPKAPLSISNEEISKISYTYTRLVEEYVINAIKHMEGGSAAFEIYYLRNMTKNENIKIVYNKMVNEFGLHPRAGTMLMDIVEWAKTTGIMASVKDFIRLYNKGTDSLTQTDSKMFSKIAYNTFFGSLVKSLFDITTSIVDAKESGFVYYDGVAVANYGVETITDDSGENDGGDKDSWMLDMFN